jgi:acetyl esterase/lipase
MQRLILFIVVAAALWVLIMPRHERVAFDAAVCAGAPLTTAEAREQAQEAGYDINPRYQCIEKASYDAVNAQRRVWEEHHAQQLAAERAKLAEAGAPDFAQQRHGFRTAIALHDSHPLRVPNPPAGLFVRSDYRNAQHYMLPAFVSPNPRDGQRHPAIVWITGGDSNSLDDFWTPGPDANDQSARAFREAGMIMAFPTLRGGNGSDSAKELFLGEVDDILSAAAQLATLSYVDPERIYLGGHSTGGTLALLTAEVKTPFKAVFAFGPVSSVDRYATLVPVRLADYDATELKLRSPIHWLSGIAQPTYLIEGGAGSNNSAELETLCAATHNPEVHCIRVPDADHFSVLRRATRVIAPRLASGADSASTFTAEDFRQ